MKRGLLAQRKNITNKLQSNDGISTLVWGMAGLCLVFVLTLMLIEKQMLHNLTSDISKDVTTALTSTAGSHIYDSYAPVRDGTSGSYVFGGTSFNEIRDTSKFKELFTQMYNDTKLSGDEIIKAKDGHTIFKITDLRLFVSNASGGGDKSIYRAEYTLVVAEDLLWQGNNLTLKNQVQTSEYMQRF